MRPAAAPAIATWILDPCALGQICPWIPTEDILPHPSDGGYLGRETYIWRGTESMLREDVVVVVGSGW